MNITHAVHTCYEFYEHSAFVVCMRFCEFVNAFESVRNCLRVCVMHNIKFFKVKNEPPFGESWLRAWNHTESDV